MYKVSYSLALLSSTLKVILVTILPPTLSDALIFWPGFTGPTPAGVPVRMRSPSAGALSHQPHHSKRDAVLRRGRSEREPNGTTESVGNAGKAKMTESEPTETHLRV